MSPSTQALVTLRFNRLSAEWARSYDDVAMVTSTRVLSGMIMLIDSLCHSILRRLPLWRERDRQMSRRCTAQARL